MPVSKKAKPAPRGDKPSAAMVRIGNNLAELKARMISATDLKLPMVFFMDALVDDEHFMAAGKLSNDKTVKALFRQVAEMLYRQSVPESSPVAQHLLITHLAAFNFSHSGGQIGGRMLTFIYFHDVDQGMAALSGRPGDDEVLFSRFSATPLDLPDEASFVPSSSQTRH